jgi:cytochrome b561
MAENKHNSQSAGWLWDQHDSFGWVSIVVHWLTTVLIVALWYLGQTISNQTPADIDARRALHVSLAVSGWLLLLLRIIWRVREGHPHAVGQSDRIHRIARGTHFAILGALLMMVVSGPVALWARANPTRFFDLVPLPVASSYHPLTADLATTTHAAAGILLLVLVLIHIGGALKHLMFNDDETVVRMLWPRSRR